MRRIGLTPPPGLINTNLHHSNCWIYLRRERNMNLIFISIHTNPHPLLNISWSNTIRQINYKLGKLFYVDNIFRILGVSVDNLGASCHLKDRLLSEYIFMGVCCNLIQIVCSSINTELLCCTQPLLLGQPHTHFVSNSLHLVVIFSDLSLKKKKRHAQFTTVPLKHLVNNVKDYVVFQLLNFFFLQCI